MPKFDYSEKKHLVAVVSNDDYALQTKRSLIKCGKILPEAKKRVSDAERKDEGLSFLDIIQHMQDLANTFIGIGDGNSPVKKPATSMDVLQQKLQNSNLFNPIVPKLGPIEFAEAAIRNTANLDEKKPRRRRRRRKRRNW